MDSKESIPSKKREIIKDLLALSGKSASGIAKQAGLNRSNVTKWLKHGGSDVGEEAQDRMLTILGGADGTLRKDIVHVWHWKLKAPDIGPLISTLEWAGGFFEMVFLAPSGRTEWNQSLLLIALYDPERPIRILLKRTVSPFISKENIPDLNPGTLSNGKVRWRPWRNGPVHLATTLIIEEKIYNEWDSGIVSIDDYDRILLQGKKTKPPTMTWDFLINELNNRGISPEEVFRKILGEIPQS